jgi:hypothetical protein
MPPPFTVFLPLVEAVRAIGCDTRSQEGILLLLREQQKTDSSEIVAATKEVEEQRRDNNCSDSDGLRIRICFIFPLTIACTFLSCAS